MLSSSKKLIKLFIGIFIFFVLTYLGFEFIFGFSDRLSEVVKNFSPNSFSALLIMGILGADILIPIPSSIVMVISGHLFGGLLGGTIAIAGSLIASILGFLISRKIGRERVIKWLGEKEYKQASTLADKYGAYTVLLTRSVPIIMESVSCVTGLSKMKLSKFIILNIIGYLPLTFLYTFTGALAKQDNQISIHNNIVLK
ncbi:MAG: TVP38/TMEM64 family protein [bacterium]